MLEVAVEQRHRCIVNVRMTVAQDGQGFLGQLLELLGIDLPYRVEQDSLDFAAG